MTRVKTYIFYTLTIFLLVSCTQSDNTTDTETDDTLETKVYHWFKEQQLPNGLLETQENGNIVSLYDNALAALVFIMKEDYDKAEKLFDFFNNRINSELKNSVGGFSQFRDKNGAPNNHRWMGDNAWLLIAINNYKAKTGNTKYDLLAAEIANWLISLQDNDGGLFAGYDSRGNLLNYKVTEGNIDAFNAIKGYSDFHKNLLQYLEDNRWNSNEKSLVSWPSNPTYLFALDLHSWGFLLFPEYPIGTLTSAEKYINSQTSTVSNNRITGYCFDEDKDVVWIEGTAQMALAFDEANMITERDFYLDEITKNVIESNHFESTAGFPYATNPGTAYGADNLWSGADDKIALSSGAWYLFAKHQFNPFAIERNKSIPLVDQFWKH